MRHVRSTTLNAVELGPFHEQVKQHCRAIIQNPDLLLSPDATGETGALDAQHWDRPEVVYCALSWVHKLPHIRPILIAFFNGALNAWERFTTEFSAEGVISQATPEQRQSAWMHPTNDASEGSLGECCQMLRRAPTMTDEQRNTRVMWRHNETYDWAKKTLTREDEAFIRKEARRIDSSGASRKARMELSVALEQKAEAGRARQARTLAKRTASKTKLAGIDIFEATTYEELSKMTIKELDSRIDKLRETDRSIQPKSKLCTKSAKITQILDGLEHLKQSIRPNNNCVSPYATLLTSGAVLENDAEAGDDLKDEEMYFDDEVLL